MGLLLSIFFGFIPMLLFATFVYWLDRYEKEPRDLLLGVFLWGVLVAGLGAFVINTSVEIGLMLFTQSEATSALATSTLVAPVIEETLKGLAVLLVFIRKRQEFDSILDGIVYASIVALGFAALENTYYIYTFGYLKSGMEGLWFLVFVRVIMVGWQHPFYTSFFGIGLALFRILPDGLKRRAAPIIGFLIAVFAHAAHNAFSSLARNPIGVFVGTTFDWVGWTFMFIFILYLINREKKFLLTHLNEEVTLGVITPAQYLTACTPSLRWRARLKALAQKRFHSTGHFYQLCAEISHKKVQLAARGEELGNSAIISQLRVELRNLSPHIHSG